MGAERVDVLIIGSGLSGLCLGRLLRLEAPELSVLVLDRAAGPRGRKVGEATVEIGGLFLDQRLQLGPLLRRSQLPKNGLRYWFDDADQTQSLTEASEDGPMTFGYWQTFQLERDSLERELLRCNRQAGVRHIFGVRGLEYTLAASSGHHRVRYTHDGATQAHDARWLVDASGWAGALGLTEPEPRVPHGAVWGRFRGFRCPAEYLRAAGDRRRIIGHRLLSTNHLMNEGYWIWWIPLASGLMSVGLCYDPSVLPAPPGNAEQFKAFLARHRMCAELMGSAELVDFGSLPNYARRPTNHFGPNRVAAIGPAGGFVDPFYSGGTDLIALGCECLLALIRGQTDPGSCNALLRTFYEQNVRYVAGQYRSFASYELRVPMYRRDIHLYWNLYAWPYFSRDLLDPAFIQRWLPLAETAHARSSWFAASVDALARRPGLLRRRNRGEYAFNQLGYRLFPYLNFEQQMGHPYDLALGRQLMDEADTGCLLALLDVHLDGNRSPLDGTLFDGASERLEEIFALPPADWQGVLDLLPESRGTATPPALTSLAGLRPTGERLQPGKTDWTFDHTPWPIAPLDWQTVYQFMESHSTSAAARYYLEPRP